ncbi:4517_t:CDS:2 [Entrophospora sp. SA101]|nr:4517_t:CDS:2 [Entrophospora sp. SA101]
MASIRGVLIDLSGVLHIGDKACEGAVLGLKKLRQTSLPIRFCTNTTTQSVSKVHNLLKNLGFEINKEEIFTSLVACRNLVISRGLSPLVFLEDEAIEDFQGVSTNEPNDSVVIGLSPSSFHYEKLNKAFKILSNNPSSTLIAIHKGKYFRDENGLSLGPGAFVEALEYSTQAKPIIVGKPERSFFEIALKDINLLDKANQVVMIVKTGKYREGDELKNSIDGVFDNFGKAVDAILEKNQQNNKPI